MAEETIFQGQNSAIQNGNDANQKLSSRSPVKRLIILGFILLIIPIILFVILNIIFPQFNSASDKETTLIYWGIREEESTIDSIISDFEKENPNINVTYLKQDPIDYREKLTTRIENGTGPDIFKFHNSWYPMFSGQLLPLPQETIEKKEFAQNFYDIAQRDLIRNGAIYGIPMEMDTLALFINTQIFEEASREQNTTISPPATWQEFIDVSMKLTKRDESGKIVIAGASIGTFENITHAPDIISLLFAQNGVDPNDLLGSEDKASDALRFYTNFALIETSVWDLTLDPSITLFYQGKLAMFFGYFGDYFEIKKANPNLVFKIVPVPQLLSGKKVNIASYWADGVSTSSKNQKEALLFMKFLARPETAQKLYQEQSKVKSLGQPYGNKNLAEDLKGSDAYIFVDQAKTAVSSPFIGGTFDNGLNESLNSILGVAIEHILSGGDVGSATRNLLEGYQVVISEHTSIPEE
ncbi:MAG: sugar ABC transporter substrate-binding protein [Candidatus Levybacteria bacterium]|nr:sugar ABC transporter substrate-binding protein [Candidatus Levybacteria bacterium]